MALQLRLLVAFAENPSLVPSTTTRWLTTACAHNSITKDPLSSSDLQSRCTQAFSPTHMIKK